jgi:hypothetical protein
MRLVTVQAVLLMVPAALLLEVELTAQEVSVGLPEQKAQLAKTIEGLSSRPITCAKGREAERGLTPREAGHLVNLALNATSEVDRHFQGESLFSSMQSGLPFTGGTYAIYSASGEIGHAVTQYKIRYGLCQAVPDEPDSERFRQVEKESQRWLDERIAGLKKLEKELADARAAFDADRIPLGVLTWALVIAQVVGWVLTVFVVLPHDMKALRERMARRANGKQLEPARARPSQVATAVSLLGVAMCIGVVIWFFDTGRTSPYAYLSPALVFRFRALGLFLSAFLYGQIGQGQNWARITFGVLFVLGLIPYGLELSAMSGRSLPLGALGAIVGAFQLMALILLFTSPGSEWFKKAPRVADLKGEGEQKGDPPVGPA